MNENAIRSYEIARDMIVDAAPAIPEMSDVVTEVAEATDVTPGTARKRLREAVAEGLLHELTPSFGWSVDLPGAADTDIPTLWLRAEHAYNGIGRRDGRKLLLTDESSARRPSSYGPGRVTLLLTPERATEIVQSYADAKKTAEDAKKAADKAEKAAVRAEIKRRAPGMVNLMRRLEFLMHYPRPDISSAKARLYEPYESRKADKSGPVEDWELILDIRAWGERSTGVLRTILEAGIEAYLCDQPVVSCAHCGERVASLDEKEGDTLWWHIRTTNIKCKGADTAAEPAKEA